MSAGVARSSEIILSQLSLHFTEGNFFFSATHEMHRSIVIANVQLKKQIIYNMKKQQLCCCRESLFSGLEWITGLLHWNGLLEHWNGLEHACHKFEFSMSTIHKHACINGKVIYTMDWLLELRHYHFIPVFVREQCSADCDTLHGYHSTMSYP